MQLTGQSAKGDVTEAELVMTVGRPLLTVEHLLQC